MLKSAVDAGGKVEESFIKRFSKIWSKKDLDNIAESQPHDSQDLLVNKKESLKKAVWKAHEKLNSVFRNSVEYRMNSKKAGLKIGFDKDTFEKNKKTACSILEMLKQETESCMERYATINAMEINLKNSITQISQQINLVKEGQNSNIDPQYQKIRDKMVKSLGLKSKDCVFAGELMDIKIEEKKWQGAIEQVLKNIAVTLIVPEKISAMVKRWLNIVDTDLSLKIKVFDFDKKYPDEYLYKDKSFINKIVIKNHPYSSWLKSHLKNLDLSCCESKKELNKMPYSITADGELHLENGNIVKKDTRLINDQKMWNLGFSNKLRLKLLFRDQFEISRQLIQNSEILENTGKELDLILQKKSLWENICSYEWDDIDVFGQRTKLKLLKFDLETIENNETKGDKPVKHLVLA